MKWYAIENEKGHPGMKGDTAVDVCDSFASEGGINPGEAVIRGTDPAGQVKTAAATDAANVIGVAIHTHKDPSESGKYYEEGYCLPVMTFGDVYVEVSGSVTAGTPAALKTANGKTVWTSTTDGGTAVTGMTYLDSGDEGEFVRVRIRK